MVTEASMCSGSEVEVPQKSKRKRKLQAFWKRDKVKPSEQDIINGLKTAYDTIDTTKVALFKDFPLSSQTLKGLKQSNYIKPTEIQRESIGLSLKGSDILGAAKTGSGKTLAFIIPVLEALYCKQWTRLDGLGALIITPTRELAYQIFETLRRVGIYHEFSAGLIIGGKDLHFEKKRMDQCNIVICTPGRLLQHMDENPLFDCSRMQILILDEADRCLDLGFQETMNNIIANLPQSRQTLLFSATQTKSVRDLARLSLKDPMYVSVHEHAKHSTPEMLQQSYVVCELHDKLNMLWSFIKNHLKKKILVFMASCKQVKYFYEIFCKLRPGTTLLALYGTLHQMKRMQVYESFSRKSNAIMFATDIAARGLDFPEVDWVVQLDCPEDSNTYIHRAGRTARFQSGGESLLVLLPSEEKGMLKELESKKIPINKIKINPTMMQSPVRKIEAFLAKDPNLKADAQRALVSYIKSVFLMKNKAIFDVQALDTDAFSRSLGLAIPPRIRFLQKINKTQQQKQHLISSEKDVDGDMESSPASLGQSQEYDDEQTDSETDEETALPQATPLSSGLKTDPKSKQDFNDGESDSEDDFLRIKRKDHELEKEIPLPDGNVQPGHSKKKPITKAAAAKKILKKKIIPNKKVIYNEDGEAVINKAKERVSEVAREYDEEDATGIDIEKAKQALREEDKYDKQLFREKVKARHKEMKKKLKKNKAGMDEADFELDGDSEEDSGPDLSWLPDPDKVFGKERDDTEEATEKGSISDGSQEESSENDIDSDQSEESENREESEEDENSDEGEEDENSDESEEDEIEPIHRPLPLKRKSHHKEENKWKKKKSNSSDEEPMDTGLSVIEDEELALHFLKHQ